MLTTVTQSLINKARENTYSFRTESRLSLSHGPALALTESDLDLLIHNNLSELHVDNLKIGNQVSKKMRSKLVMSTSLKILCFKYENSEKLYPDVVRKVPVSNSLTQLHLYSVKLKNETCSALAAGLRMNSVLEWLTMYRVESPGTSVPWVSFIPALKLRKRFTISSFELCLKDVYCFARVFQENKITSAARYHLLPQPYTIGVRGEMWRVVMSAMEKQPYVKHLLLDSQMSPIYLKKERWGYISIALRKMTLQNVSSSATRFDLI